MQYPLAISPEVNTDSMFFRNSFFSNGCVSGTLTATAMIQATFHRYFCLLQCGTVNRNMIISTKLPFSEILSQICLQT